MTKESKEQHLFLQGLDPWTQEVVDFSILGSTTAPATAPAPVPAPAAGLGLAEIPANFDALVAMMYALHDKYMMFGLSLVEYSRYCKVLKYM